MSVSDTILAAQLKLANMVEANAVSVIGGNLGVNWEPIFKGQRSVNAVVNRYSIGDTSSSVFQYAYACLTAFVGTFAGGPIDPNAQNPGMVINQTGITANYNEGIIQFTNQTVVEILNYATTLAQFYGNNPGVELFISGFTEDEQTAPTFNYLTANDPTTPLQSIIWATYPSAVSGYIKIWGSVPVSSTPGGGTGGGVTPFSYSQANLLYDSVNAQWYLPLMLPVGKNPIYTRVNGVSISATFDTTFSPPRLYSFAPNTVSQSIIVYVI